MRAWTGPPSSLATSASATPRSACRQDAPPTARGSIERATLGIFVNVSAGLDLATGLATWEFTSIDPQTLDIPDDPLVGFLPPNVTAPEGEGFIDYTVDPKASLPTGTTINAKATVIFDAELPDQSSLDTATFVNTIDAGPPSSNVSPLPATEPPSFTVSWSGQDPGGSGIATYDVYVSDNGGPFAPYLSGSTQTSATFIGQVGHSYGFYSVATDNVGYVQATPTAAEATTLVQSQATTLNPVASKDDGAWGFTQRGIWQIQSGGWNGSYRTHAAGTGSNYVQWMIAAPTNSYEIFASWIGAAGNATNATYQIKDGGTLLGSVTRDQTQTPQDGQYGGQEWASLGTYTFSTAVITVTLTDQANGAVIADGIIVNAAPPLHIGGSQPGGTLAFPAGTTLNGVVFDAGAAATVLDGNAVGLAGDVTNDSANPQTIDASLVLSGGDPTLDAASGELVMNGAISESGGSCSIVTSGDGTTILSGVNTYTGGTMVASGTLIVTSPSALPAGGSLTVESGGTFVFNCGLGAAANPSATVQDIGAGLAVPIQRVDVAQAAAAEPSASLGGSATLAAPSTANPPATKIETRAIVASAGLRPMPGTAELFGAGLGFVRWTSESVPGNWTDLEIHPTVTCTSYSCVSPLSANLPPASQSDNGRAHDAVFGAGVATGGPGPSVADLASHRLQQKGKSRSPAGQALERAADELPVVAARAGLAWPYRIVEESRAWRVAQETLTDRCIVKEKN